MHLIWPFSENTFKGYSLLKRQNRTRTSNLLPPVTDFTEHYRTHYELGDESPLEVQSCELPSCDEDDTLTRKDFDEGVHSLNSNRSPGHDNVTPEYIKHGGSVLMQWTFVLMTRIWSFACDLPHIDRIGTLLPIPKKTGGATVASFRPVCLPNNAMQTICGYLVQESARKSKRFCFLDNNQALYVGVLAAITSGF